MRHNAQMRNLGQLLVCLDSGEAALGDRALGHNTAK
jgi:hypothetical protein